MKRPRLSKGAAAPVAASAAVVDGVADPAATAPLVSDETPLPSDQISAPQEPLVPAERIVAPTETAPLPAPEPQPAPDPADMAGTKEPLQPVPGTVPLPSDQLTPLVPPAPAPVDPVIETDRDGYVAMSLDGGFESSDMSLSQLLARDLEIAGAGTVILGEDTAARLRAELPRFDAWRDMLEREIADEPDDATRFFPVTFDIEHDGEAIPPGGFVAVTRGQFARFQSATAIAADLEWIDGLTSRPGR